MSLQPHPILTELSEQLPESATTHKFIHEPKSFEEIAGQARKELLYFGNLDVLLEEGISGKSFLETNGYQEWLGDANENERLRSMGALKMISELSEAFAED